MDRLMALQAFARVVELGGFTKASRSLDIRVSRGRCPHLLLEPLICWQLTTRPIEAAVSPYPAQWEASTRQATSPAGKLHLPSE